jgi:membrane-bound ClpP family serine protease
MSDAKPVKCQKCGNPIGYMTAVARGISPFQQPVPNVKIVALCMECFRKKRIDAEPRLLTCVVEVVALADIFYRTVKWLFYARVKAQFRPIKTGKDALIGTRGVATIDLKPKGEVHVMGEFWEATAKYTSIAAGQAVEVVGMDDMFLVVKTA